MLKTVESVANELNVSKAAIYKKIKSKEYQKLVSKEKGRLMISDELFIIIKQNLRSSIKTKEITLNSCTGEKQIDIENDISINIEEILINQLKEKDKQIDKLHALIENNQILLKNQQHKEVEQLKLSEHFEEVDKKLFQLRESFEKRNPPIRKKWGFLSRKQ